MRGVANAASSAGPPARNRRLRGHAGGTRWHHVAGLALQGGPAGVFWGLAFLGPLGVLLVYSFYRAGFLTITPAFDLGGYQAAVDNGLYRDIIERTILTGFATAVLVVVLAYLFVYTITFVFPRRRELLFFLVMVALFSGYLVRIYAWRTILGDQGIINSMLESIGLIHSPLKFLIYSRLAVVIVMTNILLPFAILPVYSSMQNVPRDVIDAARDLGGGALTTFRTVTFPMTLTGARVAFAFAFVLTCGDYVTPELVGGTGGVMIGNVIADQFGITYNWPLGAALGITTMVIVLAVFLLVSKAMTLVSR